MYRDSKESEFIYCIVLNYLKDMLRFVRKLKIYKFDNAIEDISVERVVRILLTIRNLFF